MNPRLLARIKERGYWHVVIRPENYMKDRIGSLPELYPIVRSASVNLRGWDFPHLETQPPPRGLDWIEGQVEWDHYLEIWRFFKSGQFVHLGAIRNDWREKPMFAPSYARGENPTLWTADSLFKFTEIFEFASRLALSAAGDHTMQINARVVGLEGRVLYVEDERRMPLDRAYTAAINEFPYSISVSKEELVSNQRELAIVAATALFQVFGWDPIVQFLRDQQAQLRAMVG